jgi:hypothetical protein
LDSPVASDIDVARYATSEPLRRRDRFVTARRNETVIAQ